MSDIYKFFHEKPSLLFMCKNLCVKLCWIESQISSWQLSKHMIQDTQVSKALCALISINSKEHKWQNFI